MSDSRVINVCNYINNEFITKYRPIKMLKSGSYGTTFLVEYEGKRYVVKNQNYDDFIGLPILMEVNVLINLRSVPEVIGFEGVCYPKNPKSIMLILEAMDGDITDLYLQKKLDVIFFAEQLLYQMIRSLCIFQDNNMIHYDIKPNNILYKKLETEPIYTSSIPISGKRPSIDFKITDFSLTRSKIPQLEIRNFFTPSYKPPEYFDFFEDSKIKINPYAADIWSLGVSIIEFIYKKYLFYGEDDDAIMDTILDKSFTLDENIDLEEYDLDSFIKDYHTIKPKGFVNVEGILSAKLKDNYKNVPQKFIDLLISMLHWHPDHRPSARDILKNYFNEEINPKLLEEQLTRNYERKADPSIDVIINFAKYFLSFPVHKTDDLRSKINISCLLAIEIYTRFLAKYEINVQSSDKTQVTKVNNYDKIWYPLVSLLISNYYTDIGANLYDYFSILYSDTLPDYSEKGLTSYINNNYDEDLTNEELLYDYKKSLFDKELHIRQKILLNKIDFITFVKSINDVIKRNFENKVDITSLNFSHFNKSIGEW